MAAALGQASSRHTQAQRLKSTSQGSGHLHCSLAPLPVALPRAWRHCKGHLCVHTLSTRHPPGGNRDVGKWYFLTRGQKHGGCVDGGELPTRASSWPIKSNKSFPLTSEHLQRFLFQFPRDDSEDAPPSGPDQKDCHLFPHVPPHPYSMGPPYLSENWTQTSYHSPG